MASGDDPLVLADEKAAEARELLAKELFDPAIELLATALELRCMPALRAQPAHSHRNAHPLRYAVSGCTAMGTSTVLTPTSSTQTRSLRR